MRQDYWPRHGNVSQCLQRGLISKMASRALRGIRNISNVAKTGERLMMETTGRRGLVADDDSVEWSEFYHSNSYSGKAG